MFIYLYPVPGYMVRGGSCQWSITGHQLESQGGKGIFHVMLIREGFKKKKREKVWPFAKPGGGSPEVVKKPNCFFETEFFSESI